MFRDPGFGQVKWVPFAGVAEPDARGETPSSASPPQVQASASIVFGETDMDMDMAADKRKPLSTGRPTTKSSPGDVAARIFWT